MSQGQGRWPELERLHSSRDGTWTAAEQVPTQAPHEGSTSDGSKGLKKLQQRPCKLLLFVPVETRTEHFFRMRRKLREFKRLTLTQLETENRFKPWGNPVPRQWAARLSFQGPTCKASAQPKGGEEPPAGSRTPGSRSEHTGAQGTITQHSSWVSFQTEGREERNTHSTWLRLQNECSNCWSSLRSLDDRHSRNACFC